MTRWWIRSPSRNARVICLIRLDVRIARRRWPRCGRPGGSCGVLPAQPVTVPPGLGARVMARIRALVALWGAAAVLGGPGGETRIDQSVLARVARRAALAVPGVVLASALGVAVDPADRRRVSLNLRLAITFGPAIDALGAAVREQVSKHLNTQAGVQVIDVDIAVEDVVSGPSPGAELFAGRAV